MSGNPRGAANVLSQVRSLFSGFNAAKQDGDRYEDGIAIEPEPLLSLQISDEELLKLSAQWLREYDAYYKDIQDRQETNYKYWKGEQYATKSADNRGVDNIVFESTETLLPIISRQNPEPIIIADKTEEGDYLSRMTTTILERKSDDTRLKSKIKTAARHWALYFIGCFKMGWDEDIDDMYYQVINPLKLILDPKGTFDGGEFIGRYIGEKKSATAEELAETFPKFADDLAASVDQKMGTVLNYTEWWTNDYVFWQYKTVILDKRQNPYWNGDEEETGKDEYGGEVVTEKRGINHFATPKMPYAFLSVFNTGKQPHDETSLIEQVRSLQDIVNKRLRQIDKNADDTNNGWVFNNNFSQDQAKDALDAMRQGGAIIATTENVGDSVMRFPAPNLAPFVYNDMQDKRDQIYNIMGVRGSTAQGVISEKTVRGKLEIKGQDVDRLALVVEQIEQFVDHLYNLAVQTIYVHYTPENAARVLGAEDGQRYIQLLKAGPSRRLTVSVKEGSTIPQDALTKRNEAIDLWNSKALDPETLFERLDFADPKEAARKMLTFQLNPELSLQEVGGQPPAPAMESPAASVPPALPVSPQVPPQNIPLTL